MLATVLAIAVGAVVRPLMAYRFVRWLFPPDWAVRLRPPLTQTLSP